MADVSQVGFGLDLTGKEEGFQTADLLVFGRHLLAVALGFESAGAGVGCSPHSKRPSHSISRRRPAKNSWSWLDWIESSPPRKNPVPSVLSTPIRSQYSSLSTQLTR